MMMSARRILMAAALMAAVPFALPDAAVVSPAHAQVGVTFDFGNVGYGYRDGYMGRDNRYYRWQNADEARMYRSQYRDYYVYENYDRNRHHYPYRSRY